WLLDGWRWILVIGALGAVFTWAIRRGIPESPRWLESLGREAEAERVMRDIEAAVELDLGTPLPEPSALRVVAAERTPIRALFAPAHRSRPSMLSAFHLLQTVGIYGFATWAPTFMLRQGQSLGHSLEYSFLIALVSPVGPLLGVLTAERFERKRSIVVLSTLMAVVGLAFPF